MICPRCGGPLPKVTPSALGAVSRADNRTRICSPCGEDEALRGFATSKMYRVDEWPVTDPHAYGFTWTSER